MRSILRNGVGFILFRLTQSCVKQGCHEPASTLLVGDQNQFIEFFCQEHGEEAHEAQESRFEFRKESRHLRKAVRRSKRSKVRKTLLTDTEIDILLARPDALTKDELVTVVEITAHRAKIAKEYAERLARKALFPQ